ncbi:MAG: glycosyltransferase [Sporomusaceae bacterium]|nr:glycosyltransferase [Sporomusaceae bacterium]
MIISAPVGSGHIRAGQAIGAALQAADPQVRIDYADVFAFFPAVIGGSILTVYLKVLAVFPQAYAAAYGWGNSSSLALWGRTLISRFLAGQMSRYIQSFQPDAIVCTHATPAGLVADLLRRRKIAVPAVAVVTDYVAHRLWLYPEITHYCVANETLQQELADAGIAPAKSSASGIPVSTAFAAASAGRSGKLAPAILIMGGGAGLLPMEEIVASLNSLPEPVSILAVCGRNRKLYDRLSRQAATSRQRLLVYGFVEQVDELMQAADLLITKPGGLTCAEALCCGLPLLLYRPIPGQETENAKRLVQQGVAVQADTAAQLAALAANLLSDRENLTKMSRKAYGAAKPAAAAAIAQLIRRLVVK